ncbi:hypothetical protein FQN54_009009 [Arachnomyces sp. PD_36]|nr:hypothetical protein FQN54_009009 [Arachnomyces sp. PD_36]
MESEVDFNNLYATDELWKLQRFSLDIEHPSEPLAWDDDLPDISHGTFESPLGLFDQKQSNIYQLNVFGTEPLEPIDTPSWTSASEKTPTEPNDEEDDKEIEDIWSLEDITKPSQQPQTFKSWDSFPNQDFVEPVSAYLSEAGPRGYDAALAFQATNTGLENSGRIAQTDAFLDSLARLGLGWDSNFFRFNEQSRRFEKELKDVRISGISLPALDGLSEEILQCGTNVRRIRKFIHKSATTSKTSSSTSSLAGAVFVLLCCFEEQVSRICKRRPSLLQLRMLFQRCGCLIGVLVDLIEAVEVAKSDAEAVTSVFRMGDDFAVQFHWLADILHEVMSRVAKPWLSLVETWIGLKPESSTLIELNGDGKSFVDTEYIDNISSAGIKTQSVEYFYQPDMMPSFVPSEQAASIFESGKNLRLLKSFHPSHPLAREDVLEDAAAPPLHCAASWEDIERTQKKVNEYEAALRTAILKYNREGKYSKRQSSTNAHQDTQDEKSWQPIKDVFELFDFDGDSSTGVLAHDSSLSGDKLHSMFAGSQCWDLDAIPANVSTFGPPLSSSIYVSLAPLLSSQARLTDFACLHLLFKEHKVRDHLMLQWRFQLLGDGQFTSQLSHALFDPEMESGERKRGVARSGVSTGLRLGSRDTWPPASSELRLVLMGLLTDRDDVGIQPHMGDKKHTNTEAKAKELPGGLSFAIRDLAGDDLIECKNPNSVEALDFLRLQYNPPTVLQAVITPRSLDKYDRLFKHLLRLARMTSVVRGLVRDSTHRRSRVSNTRSLTQRFRIESQHFILAIEDYSFQVGVGVPWKRFERTLTRIEEYIDRGDVDSTMETAKSLHRLREQHEEILDQILFSLFLSKKHAQAGKLLEDIFRTILSFATLLQSEQQQQHRESRSLGEKTITQIHTTFRKQAGGFVRYLRSLDGVNASKSQAKHRNRSRWGSAGLSDTDATSVFDHLLLRLDMREYY